MGRNLQICSFGANEETKIWSVSIINITSATHTFPAFPAFFLFSNAEISNLCNMHVVLQVFLPYPRGLDIKSTMPESGMGEWELLLSSHFVWQSSQCRESNLTCMPQKWTPYPLLCPGLPVNLFLRPTMLWLLNTLINGLRGSLRKSVSILL